MAKFKNLTAPTTGEKITYDNGKLNVPDNPIIPFIEGDGTGPDIWAASQLVFDAAVEKAYGGKRKIEWFEVYAGEKSKNKFDEWLPEDTTEAIKEYRVAIKGPLTTPVGGGIRSINVALRQILDLYACVRPIRYYKGVPSPVKAPEKVDMIIFRENTEDIYKGIEWKAGSEEAKKVITFLNDEMNLKTPLSVETTGIGIKPVSIEGSKRLCRMAIQYALDNGRESVTFMHKGNIMKFTEGSFKDWGYEVAKDFGDKVITEDDLWENYNGKMPEGRLLIKDRIADNMFQQILLRPDEYDVIATLNLNGDYISDALAAEVGGLGIAPGGNISDEYALFEATHGTAPKYAGLDKVNPGSVILSGVMMFEHMGWKEAAQLIISAMEKSIVDKVVTYDMARQIEGATLVKCSEFAKAIVERM